MLKITRITDIYPSTKKGFSSKASSHKEEVISLTVYYNLVGSVSFFNGFMGGKAYRRRHYTPYGYVYDTTTLIAPYRERKIVDRFVFEYVD